MMIRPKSFYLALLVLCAGCASQVIVDEIPQNLPAGSAVDGIPFRVSKRFVAVIYEKRVTGYEEVSRLPVTLPDPDRLYVLNFNSSIFANPTFDLALNADNTIQSVSLKGISSANIALTNAGATISSVASANQTKNAAGFVQTGTDLGLAVAADVAKQAADLAGLQYDTLKAKQDASPVDLLAASQAKRTLELKANQAAFAAHKPPYFPGTVP